MAPILNTVDASKLLGTSRTYPLGATPTFSTHLALDKYQMQQLAKNQRKQARNFALKKAGNAYLGGVIGTASTMLGSSLGSKLFGDSKMGDFAGYALGDAASKILGSTLKVPSGGNLVDAAISGITSSVFNQNTAGGRAASSIVNGIVPKVTENITKGVKLTSGFNFGSIAGIGLGAAQAAMKPKTEYSGEKGGITSTLDMLDSAGTAAVSAIPGVGQIIGLAKMGLDTGFKALNNAGYGTSGMCVCRGTKVFKANGELINIEDLKQEDGIIGWDENSKQIVPQKIQNFIEPKEKECLEIILKNGYSIKCSIDHPVLSDDRPKAKNKKINKKRIAIRSWKFRRADELKVGDFVGLANNIDYWGERDIPNAYVVGLLIGDGSYGKWQSCRLISADPDTWKYLEDKKIGVLCHCDDKRPEKYSKEIRTYRIIGGMDLLHQLGIAYQTGKNKTLPKNIGEFSKQSVCDLLAGLFDTDGSIYVNEKKNGYSIVLYQSNMNLLEEVRIQLHKLGIFSTIGTRKAAKYKIKNRFINSKESYRLTIRDISSIIKFYNLIHLNISYKRTDLEMIYNMLKNKNSQEHNDISGAKQCKIIAIKKIGKQIVYNLQAEYNHTYLANCIITHNTTTDALLGSNIVGEALLPLSMINGKFGKTTTTLNPRTFQENQDLAKVESSYSNTVKQGIDAWNKQGKKYGLLSHGAYRKANRLVNMYGIANEALLDMVNENKIDEARIQANGLGNIQYNQDLQGGLNPRTLVAKEGAKLEPQELEIESVVPEMEIKSITPEIEIESVVPKFQEGAKLEPQELEVVVVYPSEDDMKRIIEKRWPAIKNTSEYHIYRDPEYTSEKTGKGSIEYIRQPEIKYENGFILKNPNETPTIVFNPDTNTIDDIQLDAIHHFRYADPKYQQVLKPFEDYLLQNKKGDVFWNSELGDIFRNAKQKDSSFSDFIDKNINEEYIAQGIDGVIRDLLAPDKLRKKSENDSDKFKYQPKEDADKQWLFDDTSRQLFQNIKDYLETGELKPQQFKNGGELNIIPEGALHKNLHHMENDENITKKGIPVVSEDENGKIVQNAEVERSEIVLRLSLTQKLEKMLKKYNSDISQKEKDDVATKAGQILVDELLNKTIDNTNELL